jgi:hypothetical protein
MTEPDVPEGLRGLFAAERAASVADLATRASVRAKLAATVGAAPLGSPVVTGSLLLGAKVIAGIALVIGIGAVATRTRTNEPQRPAPIAVAPPSIPAAPPALEISVSAEPGAVPAAPARAAHRPKSSPRVAVADAPSQTELLRDAWSAMSTGDAKHALALVAHDEQLHPHGALAEERDALEIEALARLRRFDEARIARDAFIARYPSSIHRTRLRSIDAEKSSP